MCGGRRGVEPAHPRLTSRADHEGPLPIIEGTVIRLAVDHLHSGGVNKPVWLWCSAVDLDAAGVDRVWQAFLPRFDIEHTFRLLKQTLGWTRPGDVSSSRPTGGPGSCWPRTRSCGWPARWSPTFATPGNTRPSTASSRPRGFDAGSATST